MDTYVSFQRSTNNRTNCRIIFPVIDQPLEMLVKTVKWLEKAGAENMQTFSFQNYCPIRKTFTTSWEVVFWHKSHEFYKKLYQQRPDPSNRYLKVPKPLQAGAAIDPLKELGHLRVYGECLLAFWKKMGNKPKSPRLKIHDMLGHVLGGALPNPEGEGYAVVAEVKFKTDAKNVLEMALALDKKDLPAAGVFLPKLQVEDRKSVV